VLQMCYSVLQVCCTVLIYTEMSFSSENIVSQGSHTLFFLTSAVWYNVLEFVAVCVACVAVAASKATHCFAQLHFLTICTHTGRGWLYVRHRCVRACVCVRVHARLVCDVRTVQ